MNRLAWPLLAFALVTIAAVAFGSLGYAWAGWARVDCWPQHCFCEAGREGAIAQPSNTYSNLAYVLVGLLILSAPVEAGAANPMRRNSAQRRVYGWAAVAIGLGSLFYHASLTVTGRWFDVMGMYLLATLIVLYNTARLRPLGGVPFAAAYIALNLVLGVVLALAPAVRLWIFGGLIALGLALEGVVLRVRRPRGAVRWLGAALACFFGAYGIWLLDNFGVWCAPQSWLQGHALWHLLTAAAAGLLFVYYRAEGD